MAHANDMAAFYHGGAVDADNQHEHMAERPQTGNESMSIDADVQSDHMGSVLTTLNKPFAQ
eukprot:4039092-Karenia_brevis.AAC.1